MALQYDNTQHFTIYCFNTNNIFLEEIINAFEKYHIDYSIRLLVNKANILNLIELGFGHIQLDEDEFIILYGDKRVEFDNNSIFKISKADINQAIKEGKPITNCFYKLYHSIVQHTPHRIPVAFKQFCLDQQ